jgi:5-methylthioadenosine/S-adenosylhomocysteine deaminase
VSLLIEDVLLRGQRRDILVRDGRIETIDQSLSPDTSPERRIDGQNKLAVPTLMNGHTHAGMTLFRGLGDDAPLQEWLEETIWPLEDKLTEEHVYWATRLACREMIQTGTTFFNDMYWHFDGIVDAVSDSGIRVMVAGVFIDQFDEDMAAQQREANKKLYQRIEELPDRIQFALGPHSIYTVSPESLQWVAQFSREHDLPVHIHLSETQHEVEQCREQHDTTPVRYLDEMDFLHENVTAAHALWLDDEEIEILADRGVSVVYNPLSNLKLTSGANFRYSDLVEAGVTVCLGTDGVASNNNLNLLEEVKMASLLQKNRTDDATALPAGEAYELATGQAADVFGLEAGSIEEGQLADLMLIDLDPPAMTLADVHQTESHLSYTLTPDAIDTVICDGNVLMEDQQLEEDQDPVRDRVRQIVDELCE